MPYPSTIGSDTTRNIEREESYVIVIGFPYSGTLYANQLVKLGTDGVVVAVAASTDRVLGRIVSAWTGTDATVRVAVPFEAHVHGLSNGTVDESNLLACTGFDTASKRPIFKVAAAGDCVSAIALTGATTGLDINVGILRQPYMI